MTIFEICYQPTTISKTPKDSTTLAHTSKRGRVASPTSSMARGLSMSSNTLNLLSPLIQAQSKMSIVITSGLLTTSPAVTSSLVLWRMTSCSTSTILPKPSWMSWTPGSTSCPWVASWLCLRNMWIVLCRGQKCHGSHFRNGRDCLGAE